MLLRTGLKDLWSYPLGYAMRTRQQLSQSEEPAAYPARASRYLLISLQDMDRPTGRKEGTISRGAP
jgi:hypothetical protein